MVVVADVRRTPRRHRHAGHVRAESVLAAAGTPSPASSAGTSENSTMLRRLRTFPEALSVLSAAATSDRRFLLMAGAEEDS
jgi:hypothetical protein